MDIKKNKIENNISINNIVSFYKYILNELKNLSDSMKVNEIYIDLEDITWVDSSFVQTFFFLVDKLKKDDISLRIKNANEIIKSEFENFFLNIDDFM